MNLLRYTTLTLLALITLSVPAQSLQEVLHTIETHNLSLKALSASAQADRLEREAANMPEGPEVQYSPFYENGKTGIGASELVVSQDFEFPTAYSDRRQQTRLAAGVLEAEYATERSRILVEAAQLCMDVIRLNQCIDMLRQRQADCDTVLLLVSRRLDAGDATSLEYNKARLTQLQVQQQLAEAIGERLEVIARLRSMAGGESVELATRQFPECRLEPDYEFFASMVLPALPEVTAMEREHRLRTHEVAMSRRSWLPSFSVGYRRNTDGDARLNGFMVGASLPLYSTRKKVQAARARQQSAALQLTDAQQQAEQTLRAQYAELQHLQGVLDHTDTQLLSETLTLLNRALQYGEITALNYYIETADIYDKLLSHINLHANYTRLFIEAHRRINF